ncbi:MAG TPA: VacJ family lipoprotein [Rudaea sp.]|nr:VacJ family lipoprotein [Rudaea sp.]
MPDNTNKTFMFEKSHGKKLQTLLTFALMSILLAGCATPMPRKDDPLERFNRRVYAFNDFADRVAIRPVAVAYRKVTNQTTRTLASNFFANLESPITIANDLLQANIKQALKATGRLAVNSTVGLLGLFDPASEMGLEASATDFAVTLAKWGVPDGPYVVLPLVGSTSLRDMWRLPVDGYFFDPLSAYGRNHDFRLNAQYLPSMAYLVTLRSRGIDAEGLLQGVYDPYIFYRDAYRQRRMYLIYRGEPPFSVIQSMQGAGDLDDADQLLQEQQQYEKQQKKKNGDND